MSSLSTQLYSEPDLIALLQSKDEKAFNYLYDNYSAALYGVIIRILDREDWAADVLQEVFLKIWRNMAQYDHAKGRLYTWMLNVARNTAIDALRSKNFQQDRKTMDIDQTVSYTEDRLSTNNNTDHVGVKKILMGLRKDFRVIIDLAYFQGYTQEEISKTLEIPLGTVKTRMRNALIELKTIFR
jgi:RNA polymerase sigma-70 factor (ECF subfamily)